MVKLQEAMFPFVSMFVQITVVCPNKNVEPVGGVHPWVFNLQLSLPAGLRTTLSRSHRPGLVVYVFVMDAHEIVGSSVSVRVTAKETVVVFPLLSLAVQATILVPLAKIEPLGGTQVILVTAQLSVAVGAVHATLLVHLPAIGLVEMPALG